MADQLEGLLLDLPDLILRQASKLGFYSSAEIDCVCVCAMISMALDDSASLQELGSAPWCVGSWIIELPRSSDDPNDSTELNPALISIRPRISLAARAVLRLERAHTNPASY